MKLLNILLVIAFCCFGWGCSGIPRLDRLHKVTVQAQQFAVDRDSSGTPDSAILQIMMYGIDKGKLRPVLGNGMTNVNMYDGTMRDSEGNMKNPIYTWEITPDDMRAFISSNYGLLCYRMVLSWPENIRPRSTGVTFQVQYKSPDDVPVYSLPVEILLRKKY